MKRSLIAGVVGMYILAVSGVGSLCYAQETETKTTAKTGAGAIVGGLLGATAGGVIGHKKGHTTEGVLIGGALGALGGAAVGSQMKTTTTVEKDAVQPTPMAASSTDVVSGVDAPKVTMKQIIYWSEQGLEADEIISRIKTSGATFVLTQEDVAYLQKKGVSQLVIEAMQGK